MFWFWRSPVSVPGSLWKATEDHYRYMLQLRTGVVLIFAEARISDDGQWVHLSDVENIQAIPLPENEFFFGRGIDVRISEIVLVADCDS